MGDVGFVTGDWAEARYHYERSAALARTTVPRYHSHALLHLAELSLLEGATEEATEHIKQGLVVAEQCSDIATTRKAGRLLAELDLAMRDAEGALARLQPLLDGLGQETPHAFPPPVLAEAYLDLGDAARAGELVLQRVERFRAQNHRRALALWLRVQGMVLAWQGHWQAAQGAFVEAVSSARAMPYPYAEARALYEWGIVFAKKGADGVVQEADGGSVTPLQEARERLQQALKIFQQLGARPYIERTEQALSALTSSR